MKSAASSVEEYLAGLPEDRRAEAERVREAILRHLPEGYEEGMQYGMIGYYVPHRLYPAGYHCDPRQPLPFAGLASQKAHLSLYLMGLYLDPELTRWFEGEYAKTGKRLDMGKSCIRFKRAGDLALEVVGEALARMPVESYVATYEANLPSSKRR